MNTIPFLCQKQKSKHIYSLVFSLVIFSAVSCLFVFPAHAKMVDGHEQAWKVIFPDASRMSEFTGTPPVATVYQADDTVLGYFFRTKQIAPIPAYSGKPMDMLVGIDKAGHIVGIKVLEHSEPILLVGIPESSLDEFVSQYADQHAEARIKVGAGHRPGYVNIDAITGATVTVMVMNRAIMKSLRAVAISKGMIVDHSEDKSSIGRLRKDYFVEADWDELTDNHAVQRMLLRRDEVDESFKNTAAENIDRAGWGEGSDTFIDLYFAYLNAPAIGRNLLGDSKYEWLMSKLKPDEHAIALLANGMYSFRGSGFVRGGIFDRILVRQADIEIAFRDTDYYRLSDVAAKGMPTFSEQAIFIIRGQHKFEPGQDWQLELLVKRQTTPLESEFSGFSSAYQLPDEYLDLPASVPDADEPIWRSVWRDRAFQIAVLIAGLALLTAIMALQDWLARYPRFLVYLRNTFMVYTLFFIGWYMLGQLSVVNVLTFAGAITGEFNWGTFLIDPMMFILWSFVAVSLLIWGRGVYCGWLCPFGALQKLVNELARKFRVRQFQLPQIIHDRLWGIKYLIFLVLFAFSLESLSNAERYAEIEPFKTAITLRFDRDLPFVLYALGLVLVSVFNCKFYCKYICPLGAALGIPAKLSLVNWLRRRKECGSPCQTCAVECEIQAINDMGVIQINECHYCLDCQVTYWDDHKCPPLVERRKRRERASKGKPAPDLLNVRKVKE